MGEVGRALYEVLNPFYEVHTKDLEDKPIVDGIEIMHVCIRHTTDLEFSTTVRDYSGQYRPRLINICTTVPPGTTERFGCPAVHSTTRGLHPNLAKGLQTITKHIGGNCAEEVASYFRRARVPCITHKRAITTEVAHLLNNIAYGVNLMFADEMAKICRIYGVDYYEAVMRYTETNNQGFAALDHTSKCRMILTPPNGKIGGHCVVMSANMLVNHTEETIPITEMLANFNGGTSEANPLRQEREVGTVLQHARNGSSGGKTGTQSLCSRT